MQDRPTAAELLDALGAFMRDRAEHARDRWERFQFQVAANSIAIIGRELEMEDGFMRDGVGEPRRACSAQRAAPAEPAQRSSREPRRAQRRNWRDRIRQGTFDGDGEEALRRPPLGDSRQQGAGSPAPNEVPATTPT